MKILAVDSSAKSASVAVCENGRLISECFVNASLTHSRTLMPMVDNALSQADMNISDIDAFCAGARALLSLPPTARVLIAEACSHIPQNEDIGRVKLPRLLRSKLGNGVQIDIVSGNDFPAELAGYDIVIHCGACMFNRRTVLSRVRQAKAQGVPITNYGVAIAALTGILDKIVL